MADSDSRPRDADDARRGAHAAAGARSSRRREQDGRRISRATAIDTRAARLRSGRSGSDSNARRKTRGH